MIDAKSVEIGMLLERIDKMVEVQNVLLDRLNIRNGCKGLAPISLQEVSPCANCSRFNHVEFRMPRNGNCAIGTGERKEEKQNKGMG